MANRGAQDPDWFISHWWGTPFVDSVRMLKFHAKIRNFPYVSKFWMCTFANNQHNLAELAVTSVLDTPFAKAILSETCKGTIALMTEKTAMPFDRIWCILEDFVSLTLTTDKQTHHLLDVASIIPDREEQIMAPEHPWNTLCAALLTDQGDGTYQDHGGDNEAEVGCWFPAEVSFRAVRIEINSAHASNQSDKTHILRLIGDQNVEVNRILRSKFAPAAMYNWACTDNTDAKKLEALLQSGLLGDQAETAKAIDKSGAMTGCCQYGSRTNNGDHRWLDALEVLLKAGASFYAPNQEGVCPLRYTITTKNNKMLDRLLEAKADLAKACDRNGPSALDVANARGNAASWEIIKKHGYERPEGFSLVDGGPPVGALLTAKRDMALLDSPTGSQIEQVKAGDSRFTSGLAIVVDGYDMVTIEPRGAVQLGENRFEVDPDPLTTSDPVIGSTLKAEKEMSIFESPFSSNVLGKVGAAGRVKTSGPKIVVDGYTMVSVEPRGAVQLGDSRFKVVEFSANEPHIGAILTAKRDMQIFGSPQSNQVIGRVEAGKSVKTAGSMVVVDGYDIVPIVPKGAVQLGESRFEVS